MGFHIFRLPSVALSEAIHIFELHDLVRLSICSLKSQNLTRGALKRSVKVPINVTLAKRTKIGIKLKGDFLYSELFYVHEATDLPQNYDLIRIGNHTIPVTKFDNECLKTYWEDPIEGIKILGDYVTNFFNSSQITHFGIYAIRSPLDPRNLLNWINNKQETIDECIYEYEGSTDKEISYFLDNCKVTNLFGCFLHPTAQFRHNIAFQADILEVANGYWLSLSNLLAMNSRFVAIQNSEFTENDMNVFLKHWFSGGCQRLDYLVARIRRTNVMTMFEDLEIDVVGNETLRTFKSYDNNSYTFNGGLDIRRNDGKTATILNSADTEYSEYFQCLMLVWPGWEHNIPEMGVRN
ncbi:unnamed protein product [Caenorhabditis brenneri]